MSSIQFGPFASCQDVSPQSLDKMQKVQIGLNSYARRPHRWLMSTRTSDKKRKKRWRKRWRPRELCPSLQQSFQQEPSATLLPMKGSVDSPWLRENAFSQESYSRELKPRRVMPVKKPK